MSYRKNGNNKAYENLKVNPDVKKHMLEACIMADKKDSLVENADELSIRRNEKMKDNKYGDILKKAIVASISVIATGAIIFGVATYNRSGKTNYVSKNKDNTINVIVPKEDIQPYTYLGLEEIKNKFTEKEVDASKIDVESVITLKEDLLNVINIEYLFAGEAISKYSVEEIEYLHDLPQGKR